MSKTASIMRAVRVHKFGGPEVLQIEQISIPKPSAGQLLIKVHAAGVNPVETYIRSGIHNIKPQLPYTPGGDGAGIVEDVGEGVSKFKKGDRIYMFKSSSGSYAEYATVDETFAFPLPINTGFAEGAALGIPYFTAYRSIVHKSHAKPGEIMLVHGASGGVGIASCQIGKAMGLKVFGTASTKEGLELALKNGAHTVFNHKEPDYLEKILQASKGGVDVVLEMLSNVNLDKDFSISKLGTRIVVIGARGSTEINPRLILAKELQVFGVNLFTPSSAEFTEMGSYVTSGLEQGLLRPATSQQFALEDVAKAHREVIEHTQGTKGKIILTIH